MASLSYCLQVTDFFLDLGNCDGGVAELLTTPTPHLSSELVRDKAGLEFVVVEDFLALTSLSLSLFLFFFCLLESPHPEGLGDP